MSSQSSTEKLRDETSSLELDEDSGHDSVDDISSPADDRERIASLETAVAWIREEVDQLKTYDKDILQELWKIRNTVQILRESGKKPKVDESRFLEEETLEDSRSPTPESQPQEPEGPSLPSSPSPPPGYKGPDGNMYSQGTLSLMATAPSHLRKSSDDLVLEEFFGSEQLTKLDMFKKQLSTDTLTDIKDSTSGSSLPQIAEEGMRPGVSMPNISNSSSSSGVAHPNTTRNGSQPKLRLTKNPVSDANRMSYDVASEMEKLRARLQETAKQELEEFDRKYSPKLQHTSMMAGESAHSRQGSLDSSVPQKISTPPLEALKSHGHSRQHSLPIDPKFLRQLQNVSNETTPTLATHKTRQSPSLGQRVSVPDRDYSMTPPQFYGHVRQVSGGSLSSEGGAFSPPLTPNQVHPENYAQNQFPTTRAPVWSGGNGGGQPYKASNPPGMARISSDGVGLNYNRGSSNSLSRASPEEDGHAWSSSTAQPHYSTAVIKRGGKRGSLEITTPPYGGGGAYKYEEKVPNGRPNAYEQPKRKSHGEEMEADMRNLRHNNSGGVGRYTQVSPPRLEGNIPASPKMSRALDRRGSAQQPSKLQTRSNDRKGIPSSAEDIEPYMTSKHVKSQMQNFNYTPFTQHQQRSYTVSAADAPKLTKAKLPKPSKNTWI